MQSKEEKKRHEEIFLSLHAEAVSQKSCVVCKHYSFDTGNSGNLDYQGDCEIGMTPYLGKQSQCEYWELHKKKAKRGRKK